MVENIEGDPCVAKLVPGAAGIIPAFPPPPTVTGKEDPPLKVNFVPPGKEVL
jgi:hypothetical protein